MKELIDKIFNKQLTEAESLLKRQLASIVEAKLGEKKKMITALDPEKAAEVKKLALKKRTGLIVQPKTGNVKRVLKSKIKSTDVQAVEEAIVHKDGLVHLAAGERVLPSVYRQRRWLAEDSTSDIQGIIKGIADRAKAAVPEKSKEIDQMSGAAQEKTPEVMNKLQDLLSKTKDAVKLKEEKKSGMPAWYDKYKLKNPSLEALAKAKEKAKDKKMKAHVRASVVKEDCGLDPDKEKKVEAAREAARLLIQPQLDTTAPTVDRTKVGIPKGVRPADRLTAPDLGPKEDEWMHGKKLNEGNFPGAPDVKMPKTDASENPHAKKYRDLHNDLRNTNPKDKEKISKTIDDIQDLVDKHLPGSPVPSKKIWLSEDYLNEMARKISDAATKAFLEKRTFKSKNTRSTGDELHLHGSKIAYHKDGKIHATMAGYPSKTTKERLNSLSSAVGGEKFHTKGGKHYYGDKEIKSDEHVILTKKKDG